MIRLSIVTPADANYKRVQEFARSVYDAKLHAAIGGDPDYFAVAQLSASDAYVGCFGLYRGDTHQPLLIETYFQDDLFRQLTKMDDAPRAWFGELGTRAVDLTREMARFSVPVSVALAGAIILFAANEGFRYLAFTANRSVRGIAKALGTTLCPLGEPDLSRKDPEFQKIWEHFFSIKQSCFYIDVLLSKEGCRRALSDLSLKGLIEYPPEKLMCVN